MDEREKYMREAIALSLESVNEGGGPFGAVIVESVSGKVVGRGKNRVTLHHDPTAHAEIESVRDASKNLMRDDLVGFVLYTSSVPCPECMAALIFNAGIKEIYYANTMTDAAAVGFADEKNWNILETTPQDMAKKAGANIAQLMHDDAQTSFKAWQAKLDKVEYYKA